MSTGLQANNHNTRYANKGWANNDLRSLFGKCWRWLPDVGPTLARCSKINR